MSENFTKVLDIFDKESIIDIVNRFYLPKAGKKAKHIERILKNHTILEYAIKKLVNESNKSELMDISEELGLESEGSVFELKQQILQKLNKTINDKDPQNKIKFLNVCFDKDGIFEILENYNLPKAGKKIKLMESIAKNDTMMESALNLWKSSYKDEIEDNCESLGIDSEGSKEKLVERISDYLFRKEKTSNTNKRISDKFEKSISNQNNTQVVDTKKNINFKNKIKKVKNYHSAFLKIINTIQDEFKPEPSSDEKELQGNLKMWLGAKYPGKKIEREVESRAGKVDIVIDGKYAIELKLARNSQTLRNLYAQLVEYQEVYPQIAVLLLNIIEKSNIELIKEYSKKYEEKLKIPTIIVQGRMRKAQGSVKRLKFELEENE